MLEVELPLRITLVKPPPGVMFALQRGRAELVQQTRSTGADLSFDFTIRQKGDPELGGVRFLGEFVQGPASGKFIYVNSGVRAGNEASPWDRRAKIHLAGLTWPDILTARDKPKNVIEARIPGTARDGGPICASVKLLGAGWQLVKK